ncbi:hypothetical protein COOONC_14811, partial [Cooperia oncophora]
IPVDIIEIDFSIWSSVIAGVNDVVQSKSIFDIVIFNAGTMFPDESSTVDGVETCFQDLSINLVPTDTENTSVFAHWENGNVTMFLSFRNKAT